MGSPFDFRLAGGSIDGSARFVTDVFVIRGSIALTTRRRCESLPSFVRREPLVRCLPR